MGLLPGIDFSSSSSATTKKVTTTTTTIDDDRIAAADQASVITASEGGIINIGAGLDDVLGFTGDQLSKEREGFQQTLLAAEEAFAGGAGQDRILQTVMLVALAGAAIFIMPKIFKAVA